MTSSHRGTRRTGILAPANRFLAGTALIGLWLSAAGAARGQDCNNNGVPDADELSLRSGLIGYWPLDGDGLDASGGGRPLSIVGGATFGAGLFGQALSLSGNAAQSAARPGDDAVFDFGSSDFTIQVWVNFNDTANEQVLIEKLTGQGGQPGGPGFALTKLAAQQFLFGANDAYVISPVQSISTGAWHQVVVRRSGATREIRFDGQSVVIANIPAAVLDTTFPLLLGKRNDAAAQGGFPLDGRLDEVAIWGRALSDSEIALLYNFGIGRHIASDCNSNGIPDDCESLVDSDGDGVIDICDNCPGMANPSQTDCNGNGMGDICESQCWHTGDMNCNGVTNLGDVTPFINVLLNGDNITQTEIADMNGDSAADGNDIDPLVDCLLGGPCGTAFSDGLPLNEHRIFVTSTRHNGNLGGIAGADAMCQACAQNAGLQRTYKAIICAPGDAAVDRLVISGPIWLWTCSGFEKVADDAADLWDGSIDRPVQFNEFGAFPGSSLSVHTGTNANGQSSATHCNIWTSTLGGQGTPGDITMTNSTWIEFGPGGCGIMRRLYCISQSHPTWNLTSDFSHTNNPTGAWSYGYYPWSGGPVDPNSFVLHSSVTTAGGLFTAGWQWYSPGIGIDPTVLRNEGADAYGVPNGWTMLHPGPSGQAAVARWTAQTAGSVHVRGQTLPGDASAENLHILQEGSELFNSGLTTSAVSFDLTTSVTIGDRIDFAVEGTYSQGSTPLSVTIVME